ncbi:hypothetical protein RRG08_015205 [Elysia crispata]|uniref:Uncharacterized protein n=1 Tax=Elysia crispata TaxID=231223 RepID=A0AAE1A7E6_9GAST|nr:hypothetical protein RRG08_015205 [Elysia crispata]
MGNQKSTPRNHNNESQDESDSEDEDVKVILEIEERADSDNAESLTKDCETCRDMYGSKMVDVRNFSLSCLPEALRKQQVLDYILIQEKIAVKIQVRKCGAMAGRLFEASGWACVSEDLVTEYASCPLQNCPGNGGDSHKAYGGITVYTNEHVISEKEEGVNCKIIFFYDRDGAECKENFHLKEDPSGRTMDGTNSSLFSLSGECILAWGMCVKQVRENKDLVALETIFHDSRLFNIIQTSFTQLQSAWVKMPKELKKELMEHVIVISHPHGRPKVVSVDKLICLEEATEGEKATRETRYSAATCKGSSGAPVVSGHYPYRPFTHSSKKEFKDRIENYSLSY